jgi:hypothetical protein
MISAVHFPNRLKGTVQRELVPAAAMFASLLVLSSAVFADDRGKIEPQLTSKYAITTPTADNTDLVTVGAVLVLQKKGLSTGDATSNVPFQNSYKDGQIHAGAAGTFSKISRFGIPGVPGVPSNPVGNTATRTFVNGEKVYVTKIELKNNTVIFSLISDPYNEVRYKGTISFEFPKNVVSSGDVASIQKTIGEVFTIDTSAANADAGQQGGPPGSPAGTAGGTAPAAAAPAEPAPAPEPVLAPVAPPPPPPDQPAAPPPTVELGQTKDMVVAILGQPQKTAKLAGKEIYFYKDLKVTFKDGKVSDVQ